MSQNRLDFLNENKIIYRRYPINDIPTETYTWGWFYEEGTYEYYNLFAPKSKITSYKSLMWHLYVLIYLNKDLEHDKFLEIVKHITDIKNGLCSFSIDDNSLHSVIQNTLKFDFEIPPKNKIKKVIFKAGSGLTISEKLSITGRLIGRNKKATDSDIYEIMLYIHHKGEKITVKKLSDALNVTTRTIYRNMPDSLKAEKDLLNEELQLTKLSKV